MRIGRVVSGGQTGVDQAGLLAARRLGIPTGGWAPRGFRTELGSMPWLGSVFDLNETDSSHYRERTECNVQEADLTIMVTVAGVKSPGSALTRRLCEEHERPVLDVLLQHQWVEAYRLVRGGGDGLLLAGMVDQWLQRYIEAVSTLEPHITASSHSWITVNVAGHRESSVRGIGHAAYGTLVWLFRTIQRVFQEKY